MNDQDGDEREQDGNDHDQDGDEREQDGDEHDHEDGKQGQKNDNADMITATAPGRRDSWWRRRFVVTDDNGPDSPGLG